MTPNHPVSLRTVLADHFSKAVAGPLLFRASRFFEGMAVQSSPQRREQLVVLATQLHLAGLHCFHPLRQPRQHPLAVAVARLFDLADQEARGDQEEATELREQLAEFVPAVLQAEEQALVKELARRLGVQLLRDFAKSPPKE